jgi:hypothetical protein
MYLKAEVVILNIRYKFGSKNLMSIIVPLLTVLKDSCNDKAVTSRSQTCVCVTF